LGKLDDAAKWRGLHELNIVPMVNQYGQVEAARRLGVSQQALSKWLKAHGYVMSITWMKATTPQELADIEAAAGRLAAWEASQESGAEDEK